MNGDPPCWADAGQGPLEAARRKRRWKAQWPAAPTDSPGLVLLPGSSYTPSPRLPLREGAPLWGKSGHGLSVQTSAPQYKPEVLRRDI